MPRSNATQGRTPAIMLQGTTSNAGKSLLCAGVCRALWREGFSVAPFKAQNMSLNSCVTPDGAEIGRAQYLQAQACGLPPTAAMNPVLLKPNTRTGSQVIVMGRAKGNMEAREYYHHKTTLWPHVTEAYDALAASHDVMVIEGAGSPAEINLKAHDIVNMRMAAYAGAHVLLVGDIDRGGVFAALIGTMACLEPEEQALVAGFILNKFRGDPTLLDDALTYTTDKTGKPFYGIMPHLGAHGLPEEDSVSFKESEFFERNDQPCAKPDTLTIACIDLPRIANFTDLDALAAEPDVRLVLVRSVRDFPEAPDAVVLPGSKSTLSDLAYLEREGLADRIRAHAVAGGADGGGGHVVGICAGFQMLGERLADPTGLEGGPEESTGLGILPLETEIMPHKTLAWTERTHTPTGHAVAGYEIHHGQTHILAPGGAVLPFADADGTPTGAGAADRSGRILGTYLHGIFDNGPFRRGWLNGLRGARGLAPIAEHAEHDLGAALDRLADAVREHLDWDAILRLIRT